ncbi:hypothetical protein OJF2_24550 [Aquisphaera giovannonii]|uniref:Protein-glutamine gamma-glutamyltransferase-like C-terminal domain-containing protein n=1 Tax=Aquisphaera giovannonii TaxID=406548 RepID=A0A5B9W077_9BACT|nr:DUF4129 domain-containing protein [Aquisphaera giovannonii]QEH33923.1 hypothetical protein OJF2_24550 [Aquisphaera giovannonii]
MTALRLAFAASCLLGALAAGCRPAAAAPPGDDAAGSQARSAIRRQAYPWYDADRDEVRPLIPARSSWSRRLEGWMESIGAWFRRHFGGNDEGASGGRAGSLLSTLLFAIAGAALVALCWRLWRMHERGPDRGAMTATVGEAARVAGLTPGEGLEGADPWAEADRLLAAGDRRGAVTWLFLGQLLVLDRARVIRIAPGKTGRQYAAMIEDPGLGDALRATLAVFEQVYYGRKDPDPHVVEALFRRATGFRRRLSEIEGVAGS